MILQTGDSASPGPDAGRKKELLGSCKQGLKTGLFMFGVWGGCIVNFLIYCR